MRTILAGTYSPGLRRPRHLFVKVSSLERLPSFAEVGKLEFLRSEVNRHRSDQLCRVAACLCVPGLLADNVHKLKKKRESRVGLARIISQLGVQGQVHKTALLKRAEGSLLMGMTVEVK